MWDYWNGGLTLVQKGHPCIALPCVCTLSMGIGIILTLLMGLFTSQAGFIAANLILILSGVWFIILSGVWFTIDEPSTIWTVSTGLIGWLFIFSGLLGSMSPISGMALGTGIGLFVFIIAYFIIDIEADSIIPIPYPTCGGRYEGDTEHQSEYLSEEVRHDYRPTKSCKSSIASMPIYWRSWKGEIIRAIAEARTPLTLSEISERSKLDSNAALSVIGELYDIGVILYENDHKYSVERGVYHEYRAYIKENQRSTPDYAKPSSIPQKTWKHIHRTNNGEMVRSKSEVIVANTLARLGIFYEYEKRLHNPYDKNDSLLPDFTIHHDGKIFYWEHLGMLWDSSYKKKWEWKMDWYRKCGYEVITSRDSDDGSIDSQIIEAIAKNRILQS